MPHPDGALRSICALIILGHFFERLKKMQAPLTPTLPNPANVYQDMAYFLQRLCVYSKKSG